MKKVAIVQSNYIPWKGYFDLIAAADEFIIYDEVQFTKNDWRNRNKIKTPNGTEWISIPVGQDISRRVCDVKLPSKIWQIKHWKTLEANYRKAPCFKEVSDILVPLYLEKSYIDLSIVNKTFISTICHFLGIHTKIKYSSEYELIGSRTERLINLCLQAGGDTYISGPSAKNYIDETEFTNRGVTINWFDYSGYPEYSQLWGEFKHEVSIVDLLFNCGRRAVNYMKFL